MNIDRELLIEIRDFVSRNTTDPKCIELAYKIDKLLQRPSSVWKKMSDGVWLGTDNVSGRMMTIAHRQLGHFWSVDGMGLSGREDTEEDAMEAALFAARKSVQK